MERNIVEEADKIIKFISGEEVSSFCLLGTPETDYTPGAWMAAFPYREDGEFTHRYSVILLNRYKHDFARFCRQITELPGEEMMVNRRMQPGWEKQLRQAYRRAVLAQSPIAVLCMGESQEETVADLYLAPGLIPSMVIPDFKGAVGAGLRFEVVG